MNMIHDTIDEKLRDFYRSEMPDPWPVMRTPARTLPLVKRTSRPVWLRSVTRLAVAASIALLLISYLALASLFPRESGVRPGLTPATDGTFGDRPGHDRPGTSGKPKAKAPILTDFPGGFTVSPAEPSRR